MAWALSAGVGGALVIGSGVAAGGGIASAASVTAAPLSSALPTSNWLGYLNGPLHTSYNSSQTVITPANATKLAQQWSFTAGSPYVASPTVTSTAVYIGSAQGWFYKLSVHTGKVLNKVYIGRQPSVTCPATGVTSTAAVGVDPSGHVRTVYVAGGNGYLYALRASNLTREWRAVVAIPSAKTNDYYNWSSPTIAHGRIYLGIASSCDVPLIRGGVVAYSQASGRKLAEFYTVPAGAKNAGGSVWTSIGVAPDGDVYATTGNGPAAAPRLQNSESILKLDPDTLKLLGSYKVPASQVTSDGDFGGSPVFFGNDVGACNKNGYFYALNQSTMKLAWTARIGRSSGGPQRGECLASPAYNGKDLYFGGNQTYYEGALQPGSVQERSPATGALIWKTSLQGGVMGSPTMDGAGLIAVGTYSPAPDGIYLVNAGTGAVIGQLAAGWTFAQSVFADSWIFTATSNGVAAWGLPVN